MTQTVWVKFTVKGAQVRWVLSRRSPPHPPGLGKLLATGFGGPVRVVLCLLLRPRISSGRPQSSCPTGTERGPASSQAALGGHGHRACMSPDLTAGYVSADADHPIEKEKHAKCNFLTREAHSPPHPTFFSQETPPVRDLIDDHSGNVRRPPPHPPRPGASGSKFNRRTSSNCP